MVCNYYQGLTFSTLVDEVYDGGLGTKFPVERVLHIHSLKRKNAFVTSEMVDHALAISRAQSHSAPHNRVAKLIRTIDAEAKEFQDGMTSHRILAEHLAETFMRRCKDPAVESLSVLEHQV